MRAMKRIFARVRNFATNHGEDERLREEIEYHIVLETDENIRAGMPPVEAWRAARLKFGAIEAVREHYHAEEGLPIMENLLYMSFG
jgi:hypothetical protein